MDVRWSSRYAMGPGRMTRVERNREGIEMKGLVRMMTSVRGLSNATARAELDWVPRYPSGRQGFAAEFA